jgi:UTP--glucose-1-phosphate uridylyltransferase
MNKPIRKAVFPVAGLGTRFLPATKSVPKEMQTIVDRPLIQYVVDEAREAGIEQFIFVTGRNKSAIEDYFDVAYELETILRASGKEARLRDLARSLPRAGEASFTRQQEPRGLGHAVWCARHLVGDEPFAVVLPDMIMQGERGCLAQMLDTYEQTGGSVIAVETCAPDRTSQYGIVGTGTPIGRSAFAITEMVEKPAPAVAPSNLFINGRYILQPDIFAHLERQKPGAGGEIQLTDAMICLSQEQPFYGHRFVGRSFDCGSREGFIAANIAFALGDADLSRIVRRELNLHFRLDAIDRPDDRPSLPSSRAA